MVPTQTTNPKFHQNVIGIWDLLFGSCYLLFDACYLELVICYLVLEF